MAFREPVFIQTALIREVYKSLASVSLKDAADPE
jgi:hypothetical protein